MLQQENNKQPGDQQAAQNSPTSQYVTTIRDGAVGASIFLAERKDGSQGHYFKMSRSYKGNDQSEFKYSENFYAKNGQAIATVATKAAEKCELFDKELKQ